MAQNSQTLQLQAILDTYTYSTNVPATTLKVFLICQNIQYVVKGTLVLQAQNSPFQQQWLRDYRLALFVLCLVIIDLLILGVYTLIEGISGNLGVKLTTNRENPEETIGVRTSIYLCIC